jgi:hypothetical protein
MLRPSLLLLDPTESCHRDCRDAKSGCFEPKTWQKLLKSGSKMRVLFIDQLTGVFSNLFIPWCLPPCMGRKNHPKWEKKCGLRGWYRRFPSLTDFAHMVSYLQVCAKGGY